MQKRIILVEDKYIQRLDLQRVLTREGFEVVSCANGFDAFSRLRSDGADLVISPYSIPDFPGNNLALLIKSDRQARDIPVLLIKSGGERERLSDFSDLLAEATMVAEEKTTAQDVVALVKELLLKRTAENEDGQSLNGRQGAGSPHIDSEHELVEILLLERLVCRTANSLMQSFETSEQFIERYFHAVKPIFDCEVQGIVCLNPEGPWAALKVSPAVSKRALDDIWQKVADNMKLSTDVHIELIGEPGASSNVREAELQLLPVTDGQTLYGAVFFACAGRSFEPKLVTAAAELQNQMLPVLRLVWLKLENAGLYKREQLRASKDPLTKVHDQEFFLGFLRQQLVFSYRLRLPMSLGMVSIDNFKELNSEYGFEAGDRLLSAVATILLQKTRASDLIARNGRVEFAVVLPNTDIKGAEVVAEKIRKEIEQTNFSSVLGRDKSVTVSVGFARFNMKDLDIDIILNSARDALAKAKAAGGNSIVADNA